MNGMTLRGGSVPLLLVALVLVIAVALPASQPALAAPSGECVTARVESPFRLPDGALHPAGSLTLCDTRTLSPVADLHTIRVNGSSVGMFASRKRTTEARLLTRPQIVFNRVADGTLDLVGYVLPAPGRSVAFRLSDDAALQRAAGGGRAGGDSAPAAAIIAKAGER